MIKIGVLVLKQINFLYKVNRVSVLTAGIFILMQLSCKTGSIIQLLPSIAFETQNRIDNGFHLGTVIGIIDQNGTRYYGFGQTSLTNKSKPNENSIFEIGSITKTFNATLLADLDAKGEMDLQNSIGTYLPVFSNVVTDSTKKITLESLVTHTSGLPREPRNMNPNDDNRYKNYSSKDLVEFLSAYKQDLVSNTFSYSNLGVLIAEYAIETETKMEYEVLVKKRVLDMLDMNDSYFEVPESKRHHLVKGYKDSKETEELDLGEFQSMGGLRSTVKDMLKYLSAQLYPTSSGLTEAIEATQKVHFSSKELSMGLGWEIVQRKKSGKTIYFHKGGTNGFVSFAGFDLEGKIGVVVLVNGRNWFSDLGFKLIDPSYPLSKPGNN
ncbi:MAG: serine hydrolase domain-containing protein [Bacteroidota bacterium]